MPLHSQVRSVLLYLTTVMLRYNHCYFFSVVAVMIRCSIAVDNSAFYARALEQTISTISITVVPRSPTI